MAAKKPVTILNSEYIKFGVFQARKKFLEIWRTLLSQYVCVSADRFYNDNTNGSFIVYWAHYNFYSK